MEIPLYLAMTAGEFSTCTSLPSKVAWMACHFSSSGEGLSNIPNSLPQHSLLILDDSIPIANHRTEVILNELFGIVETLVPDGVLLDFQRPGDVETEILVKEIAAALPCPVGVSHHYARGLACPIFLPPLPAHMPLAEYLSLHKKKEVWLELAPVWEEIIVTENGSEYRTSDHAPTSFGRHRDNALYCHYDTSLLDNSVIFSLGRIQEDLDSLLSAAAQYGVTRGVGLYQELA